MRESIDGISEEPRERRSADAPGDMLKLAGLLTTG